MSLVNFSCLRNVSKDSVTEIGWIVDHPDDPNTDTVGAGYATSVLVSLIFLTGVPWNLFIICIIVKKRLYSNPTIMLLLNLAITNLLLGLLVMPFNIITGFSGEYLFGSTDEVRCHVCQTGIFLTLLALVSIHVISLMSIDRFFFLKWPLQYKDLITVKKMFTAIAIIWIICTVISLPPLFGFGEIKFTFRLSTCWVTSVGMTHIAPNYYYALLITTEALVPIFVLFILYIWIICIVRKSVVDKLRRSRTNRAADTQESEQDEKVSSIRSTQLRLVRVFVMIFSANLLTWLPIAIMAMTGAIVGAELIPASIYVFPYVSFLSETVIHPMLETCLIKEVRVIAVNYVGWCGRKIKLCQ